MEVVVSSEGSPEGKRARSRENTGVYSKKSICDQIEAWFNDYELHQGISEVNFSLLTGRWGTMVKNRHQIDLKTLLYEDGRFALSMNKNGGTRVSLSRSANRDNYGGALSEKVAAERARRREESASEELSETDRKLITLQGYIKEKGIPLGPESMKLYWPDLYPNDPFPE
jgi:hypothetical protein